jgi:hypothetical protein
LRSWVDAKRSDKVREILFADHLMRVLFFSNGINGIQTVKTLPHPRRLLLPEGLFPFQPRFLAPRRPLPSLRGHVELLTYGLCAFEPKMIGVKTVGHEWRQQHRAMSYRLFMEPEYVSAISGNTRYVLYIIMESHHL